MKEGGSAISPFGFRHGGDCEAEYLLPRAGGLRRGRPATRASGCGQGRGRVLLCLTIGLDQAAGSPPGQKPEICAAGHRPRPASIKRWGSTPLEQEPAGPLLL